jgi:hypothetical protein
MSKKFKRKSGAGAARASAPREAEAPRARRVRFYAAALSALALLTAGYAATRYEPVRLAVRMRPLTAPVVPQQTPLPLAKEYVYAGGRLVATEEPTPVPTPTPTPACTPPTTLIISEFRLRGPAGPKDEFVEFYNNSDAAITVCTADQSTGWALSARKADGSSAVTVFVIPYGTVVPARGHLLAVNNSTGGYSLSNHPAGPGATATGDITYTADIEDNVGIALFNTANTANFTSANRLDAAGSTSEASTLYREGAGYAPLSGAAYTAGIDYSFYRDTCGKGGSTTTLGGCPTGGAVKDSNDNAADFIFVDTYGNNAGAGQRLGAPGPENLSSPVLRNSAIAAALLDPCVGGSSPPNRVRDFTSVPAQNSTFGTLDFRYTFTNVSGAAVTRLRFRIIDLTTFPVPSGYADLRPRSSADVVVTVDRAPCGSGTSNVTVRGTTLEQPPSQPNGGGFNSTLSAGAVTLATPLADGASIDLRFLLGIQQTGSYKFYLNVEAAP